MAAQPHIVYDPPYGGQAIRAKSHRDAFARAAELLRSVTDADPDVPEALELEIFEPSPDESRGWLEPSVRTAEARLGPGHRRRWATGTLDLHLVGWRLERAAIAPLLELLEEVDPRERTTYGPVSLWAWYSFRWIDPDTRLVLPGQDEGDRAHPTQATSTLQLTLERRPSAILHGRFPFAAPDAHAAAYVRRVMAVAPFSLSSARFRLWVPTRKKSDLGYAIRRIDAPWLKDPGPGPSPGRV